MPAARRRSPRAIPLPALGVIVVVAAAATGCPPPPILPHPAWRLDVFSGFEGSPTYCDLEGDGVVEAILPVAPTDHPERSYLHVVQARDGKPLFRTADGDGSFAYPLCVDVDDDGVLDLITGGRIRDVVAISGTTGERLWTLSENEPDLTLHNTYSAVATDEDPSFFAVTTGGGAPPGAPERYTGALLIVGEDGSLRARWEEPLGREIYSTPAILEEREGTFLLAVGSGGETLDGSLYLVRYDPADESLTTVAEVPSACQSGGFIASPTLGDLDGDGVPEVLGSDWCGALVAVGLDGQERWRASLAHPYTTGNPLLVDLDGDGLYDVITSSGEFNWTLPETFGRRDSQVAAYRGTDGALLWTDDVEKHLWASPVSADYDGDGTEDVWTVAADVDERGGTPPPSLLRVLSGADGVPLYEREGVSWMGTPLLDDADQNGFLDVLLIHAPFTATAFGTGFQPSEAMLVDFEGVPFDPARTFSGFRGPRHDGHRR